MDALDTASEQTKIYSVLSPEEQTTSFTNWTEQDVKFNDNLSLDASKYGATYFNLLLNERFRPFDNPDAQAAINNPSGVLATSAYLFDKSGSGYLRDTYRTYLSLFGAFVYYFKIYDGDDLVGEKMFFVECCKRKPKFSAKQQTYFNNSIKKWMVDNIGHEVDYRVMNKTVINAVTPADTDNHFITFENDIDLNFPLPNSSNVRVKLLRNYILLGRTVPFDNTIEKYDWYSFKDPNGNLTKKMIYRFTGDAVYNYSQNWKFLGSMTAFESQSIVSVNSSVYYGSNEFKSQYISKADLFANTASPFKYLVD